jgi:glycosyltransferase involved in cell wall biosynthesis
MIYLNSAKESWVVDRFRNEWYKYNKDISTRFISRSQIVWLIAPWTWEKLNVEYLNSRKIICTIHHIDTEKFDRNEEDNFYARDKYVNIYHAISKKTENQIKLLTNKPIVTIPFWVNQRIWFQINNKDKLLTKYGLNKNDYIVGSFQRDTEGSDLKSPKLSKGPDRLAKILIEMNQTRKNLHVLLAGKRRNYLIDILKDQNINYSYFEMAKFKNLNELYNCLNLYIVTSRVEGGPQAVVECASAQVPIISTDVGNASNILSDSSIFDMNSFNSASPDILHAKEKVEYLYMPKGFEQFRNLLTKQ